MITKEKIQRKIVIDENGCWIWQGHISKGYGMYFINRKGYKIHRLSMYLFKNFDLNSDLCICHKCDNKRCCNPNHLFVGTHKDNMKDAYDKGIIRNGKYGLFNTDKSNKKVDDEDKKEIINLYNSGMFIQKELAEMFNISVQHVSRIIRGFTR